MIHTLVIKPVLNGYLVSAGCQNLVFPTLPLLVANIEAYYSDPDNTEKRFRENSINKALLHCPPAPALCVDQTISASPRTL